MPFFANVGGSAPLLFQQLAALGFFAETFVNLVVKFDVVIVALEEEIVLIAVGVRVHKDRAAGFAVASRAADFLVISFNAAGQGSVDDGADIGFVDTHPEGDGGNDDLEFAIEKTVLDAAAAIGV